MTNRIVIIGDELRTLKVLSKILATGNPRMDVRHFLYQKDKEPCFAGINPEIILLDFINPLEFAEATVLFIRKLKELKGVPLLLLTSFTSSILIQNAFDAGVDDFARKPVNRNELKLRIHSLLVKRKLQEENLRQSDELAKFSLAADKSDNSIVFFNSEGEIEWVNRGFKKLYKLTLNEFKGVLNKNVGDYKLFHNIKNLLKQAEQSKKSVSYENVLQTKKGKIKCLKTTITPVINAENKIERFIAVETDITNLKAIEEELSRKNANLIELTKSMELKTQRLEKQQMEIEEKKKLIETQRKKADELLMNIFPAEIAEQLKINGYARSKLYRMASVMFTDFVGFSKIAEKLSTQKLIHELSSYFEMFDKITSWHFVEKIKTIGDSYMCAGGLPLKNKSNPIDIVLAGLEILSFIKKTNLKKTLAGEPCWDIRIGIHTGEVIAGVIGHTKMAYDIWGDTVNLASRMETSGAAGKINISGATYEHIKHYFKCTYRGRIILKNKNAIDMYFVEGLLPKYSEASEGIFPNAKFLSIHSSF